MTRWSYTSLLIVIFFISTISTAKAQQIVTIKFSGLKKTTPPYLFNIIQSFPPNAVDSSKLEEDVQSLKNLRHFEHVSYKLNPLDSSGKEVELEFIVVEGFSLFPNLDMGATKDLYRLQLGIIDFNSLGRGGLINLYIRQYGRTSFFFSGDYPYLLRKKRGFALNLQKNSTFDPVYLTTGTYEYNHDLWSALFFYRYDKNLNTIYKIGGGYQYQEFWKRKSDSLINYLPYKQQTNRFMIRLNYKYYKIDYEKVYQQGYSAEITAESITSFEGLGQKKLNNELSGNALKYLLELKYYNQPYRKGNIAARVRLGMALAKQFDQFLIDDNVNIRGAGYRVERRPYEFSVNLEYRQTCFQHTYGSVQLVGFGDYTPGFIHSGMGIRMYIQKLHNVVLRCDYGINVSNFSKKGFVAGIHQYF